MGYFQNRSCPSRGKRAITRRAHHSYVAETADFETPLRTGPSSSPSCNQLQNRESSQTHLFFLPCFAVARQGFSLGSQLLRIEYTTNTVLKCFCVFLCTQGGPHYVDVSRTKMFWLDPIEMQYGKLLRTPCSRGRCGGVSLRPTTARFSHFRLNFFAHHFPYTVLPFHICSRCIISTSRRSMQASSH